jgi:hypothetical protein
MNDRRIVRRVRRESGQALTEYSTTLGILVALIIAVTTYLVPGIALVIVRLARHMSVYLTRPVS